MQAATFVLNDTINHNDIGQTDLWIEIVIQITWRASTRTGKGSISGPCLAELTSLSTRPLVVPTKMTSWCVLKPESWTPGTPESTAMTVNLSPRLVLIKNGILWTVGTALSTRVWCLIKFMPSSVGFASQLPGLGFGVSALDIGNQFEFRVDCALNGSFSKL